ncbi:MAG: hypothetical protein P8188_01065 [Gemmatimonadota bacterium]
MIHPGPDGGHDTGASVPDATPPAGGAEEDELTDPAHRTARWFMVLAPVVLVVLVFLLLRLSTG